MKQRNKAWRRFQEQKSKQKAYKIFKLAHRDKECGLSEEEIQHKAARNHNHMKNCSNPECCGNPRRLKGRDGFNTKTMQENRFEQGFHMQDLFNLNDQGN